MKRAFALLFCCCLGCETTVANLPVGPVHTTPLIAPFDGSWEVWLDADGDFLVDYVTCIQVNNSVVIAMWDGCDFSFPNQIISPPLVYYDDVGPYFALFWEGLGIVEMYFDPVTINNYNGVYVIDGSQYSGYAIRA